MSNFGINDQNKKVGTISIDPNAGAIVNSAPNSGETATAWMCRTQGVTQEIALQLLKSNNLPENMTAEEFVAFLDGGVAGGDGTLTKAEVAIITNQQKSTESLDADKGKTDYEKSLAAPVDPNKMTPEQLAETKKDTIGELIKDSKGALDIEKLKNYLKEKGLDGEKYIAKMMKEIGVTDSASLKLDQVLRRFDMNGDNVMTKAEMQLSYETTHNGTDTPPSLPAEGFESYLKNTFSASQKDTDKKDSIKIFLEMNGIEKNDADKIAEVLKSKDAESVKKALTNGKTETAYTPEIIQKAIGSYLSIDAEGVMIQGVSKKSEYAAGTAKAPDWKGGLEVEMSKTSLNQDVAQFTNAFIDPSDNNKKTKAFETIQGLAPKNNTEQNISVAQLNTYANSGDEVPAIAGLPKEFVKKMVADTETMKKLDMASGGYNDNLIEIKNFADWEKKVAKEDGVSFDTMSNTRNTWAGMNQILDDNNLDKKSRENLLLNPLMSESNKVFDVNADQAVKDSVKNIDDVSVKEADGTTPRSIKSIATEIAVKIKDTPNGDNQDAMNANIKKYLDSIKSMPNPPKDMLYMATMQQVMDKMVHEDFGDNKEKREKIFRGMGAWINSDDQKDARGILHKMFITSITATKDAAELFYTGDKEDNDHFTKMRQLINDGNVMELMKEENFGNPDQFWHDKKRDGQIKREDVLRSLVDHDKGLNKKGKIA